MAAGIYEVVWAAGWRNKSGSSSPHESTVQKDVIDKAETLDGGPRFRGSTRSGRRSQYSQEINTVLAQPRKSHADARTSFQRSSSFCSVKVRRRTSTRPGIVRPAGDHSLEIVNSPDSRDEHGPTAGEKHDDYQGVPRTDLGTSLGRSPYVTAVTCSPLPDERKIWRNWQRNLGGDYDPNAARTRPGVFRRFFGMSFCRQQREWKPFEARGLVQRDRPGQIADPVAGSAEIIATTLALAPTFSQRKVTAF